MLGFTLHMLSAKSVVQVLLMRVSCKGMDDVGLGQER